MTLFLIDYQCVFQPDSIVAHRLNKTEAPKENCGLDTSRSVSTAQLVNTGTERNQQENMSQYAAVKFLEKNKTKQKKQTKNDNTLSKMSHVSDLCYTVREYTQSSVTGSLKV